MKDKLCLTLAVIPLDDHRGPRVVAVGHGPSAVLLDLPYVHQTPTNCGVKLSDYYQSNAPIQCPLKSYEALTNENPNSLVVGYWNTEDKNK